MESILFSHIKAIMIPCVLLIFAFGLIRKRRRDWISMFVGVIFILFGIKTGYDWIKYPSFSESKKYYQEFRNLKKESIQKIILETEIINRQKTKNIKSFTDKESIDKIFNSIVENESAPFGFSSWTVESSYYIKLLSFDSIYEFHITESADNRSYINLIYNRDTRNTNIGNYRNVSIKNLNLLE